MTETDTGATEDGAEQESDQNLSMSEPPPDERPGQWLYAREIRHDVIRRTIAQIYLLIDNITATLSKELPSIPGLTITNKDDKNGSPPGQWLERVCEIEWPPAGGSAVDEAKTAADLVQIRDALNHCASPSSDMSIAFSLLVVGDLEIVKGKRAPPGAADASIGASHPGLELEYDTGRSRLELALLAFPQLRRRVRPTRGALFIITPLILFLLLAVTTVLSFDAAQGTALVTQLTAAQTTSNSLQDQLARLQKTNSFRTAHRAALTTPPAEHARTPAPPAPAPQPAQSAEATDTATPAPTPTEAPDQQRLESAAASATQDLAVATANLEAWAQANEWLAYCSNHMPSGGTDTPVPAYNIQRAAAVLGALISIVLPTLYGAIGATAGQVRDTYLRIKTNQLMPRHGSLFAMPVLLGLISGATIGLFFAPSTDAASTAANTVTGWHLTASALAFLGGLGAEGVFDKFLELLRRVLGVSSDMPGAVRQ